jgi:hypothetical protein
MPSLISNNALDAALSADSELRKLATLLNKLTEFEQGTAGLWPVIEAAEQCSLLLSDRDAPAAGRLNAFALRLTRFAESQDQGRQPAPEVAELLAAIRDVDDTD